MTYYDRQREYLTNMYLANIQVAKEKGDNNAVDLNMQALQDIELRTQKSILTDVQKICYNVASGDLNILSSDYFQKFFSNISNGMQIYQDILNGKYRNNENELSQVLLYASGFNGNIEELSEEKSNGKQI